MPFLSTSVKRIFGFILRDGYSVLEFQTPHSKAYKISEINLLDCKAACRGNVDDTNFEGNYLNY